MEVGTHTDEQGLSVDKASPFYQSPDNTSNTFEINVGQGT